MKFRITNEINPSSGFYLFEDENGNKYDTKEFNIEVNGVPKTISLEASPDGWINSYMISSKYELKPNCKCHPLIEKVSEKYHE